MFLPGDIAEKVQKLKSEDGPDLHVRGSGNLIQTLLKHDLVDELWLNIDWHEDVWATRSSGSRSNSASRRAYFSQAA